MWDSQTGISPLISPAVTHLEPPVPNAIPKQLVRPREPEVGIAEEYEMIPGPAASVNEAAETPVPMDTEGLAQAAELLRQVHAIQQAHRRDPALSSQLAALLEQFSMATSAPTPAPQ